VALLVIALLVLVGFIAVVRRRIAQRR
jgi:hypothetical protein